MMGTQEYFRQRVLLVDALAEVHFDIEIPYAIRVRPSHPRYFEAVCKRVLEEKPVGILVSVMKEVDFFPSYEPESEFVWTPPKKKTWYRRLFEWLT